MPDPMHSTKEQWVHEDLHALQQTLEVAKVL